MDLSLAVLKFAAVLTAGIWGTVGLMVDYRKDGVITIWGRRALIGAIASAVIAIITQSLETYKQHLDSLAASERVTVLLKQINRRLSEILCSEPVG
jgi:hypothetical protein